MKEAAGIFLGIVYVFVVSSVLVRLMLNILRIANAIEEISNRQSLEVHQ